MRPIVAARVRRSVAAWFDAHAADPGAPDDDRIDLMRLLPFIAIHLGCLAVWWVGVSATAVAVAVALYALRMFAITAFYHRYFSHNAFRTGRVAQFVFALLGASAAQRGPLWWASHHRHHHVHADEHEDSHSALRHGLWRSHVGWFMSRANFAPRGALVTALARYPELRFLDRWDVLVPLLLCALLYAAGEAAAALAPGSGTSGAQLLVWGFCISTVALYHATFSINSLAHRYGARRYATRDASRNNLWLALLTFGEGWHNNHHHYPAAARQGFYWWEIDLTYYGLKLLQCVGIVWDVREVPAAARDAHPRALKAQA
ncbi:MAG: acyl-CoA desaturase [Burkholderiaceae bacterium]|nr:acyl-CoA desaturase [Burkholderiaceae bacterium]